MIKRAELLTALLAAVMVCAAPCRGWTGQGSDAGFLHPGLLHTTEDLARMRRHVSAGDEPWRGGFQKLSEHECSKANWRVRGAREIVTRDPKGSSGDREMVVDGNAAYQNALMWCVTGDTNHAEKAIQILNAWAATLKTINGHDRQLSAGLNGFKFVNAAELMRLYDRWGASEIIAFKKMLKTTVVPAIDQFATHANGNWDAACIKTLMTAGVFCDDRALFDKAVAYFRNGSGNGRVTHYIINADGQCQESGRDQQHTQLGLGALAEACEIAWHQGVDLYAEANNRLLAGFEYTARYNLGDDAVPFVAHIDTTGKYRHTRISDKGRFQLRAIYEMVWNHYENRRGISAPYTRQAAEKIRPEGAGFNSDHPGFGTLLFYTQTDFVAKNQEL